MKIEEHLEALERHNKHLQETVIKLQELVKTEPNTEKTYFVTFEFEYCKNHPVVEFKSQNHLINRSANMLQSELISTEYVSNVQIHEYKL